jgi:NagD protein
MVGDRIYTDMEMAQEAGVPAALVLTGETTAANAAGLPHQPDLTVADIGQLGELLANVRRVIAS